MHGHSHSHPPQPGKISFDSFLNAFPEVELPLILGENTHLEFSRRNDPLTPAMIEQFIEPLEDTETDDLTEYIACFRLSKMKDFHAIVYWKASLMDYRYTLVTFSKDGKPIDKRVIAGMFSDGETITQSVATIDEHRNIAIATGQSDARSGVFDPNASTAYALELLEDGTISDE